jgi:hypothetical protein
MRLRYDRAILLGSGIALGFFVLTGVILYFIAPADAKLKTELIKSLFDKVALGGVLAAFALIIGWYIEDAKARRTFVATAQLTAATDMLARASALATAASEWLYYEAPHPPAEQPYGSVFERETIAFGRSWGPKSALLSPYFDAALKRFAELLIEPYYLYRDRAPNPLATLGTTNLDAAEFVGVLEKSLYCEFLASVGAPADQPEISLSTPQRSKETFGEALARWDQARNAGLGNIKG